MPHDSHDNDLDDFAKHVLSHIAEWGMETLRVIFVISVEYQVGEPFGMLNGYEAITGFLCDYPAPASQIELVTEALHAPHPDIPDGYHASIVVMCDPRYLCPSDYQRRDTHARDAIDLFLSTHDEPDDIKDQLYAAIDPDRKEHRLDQPSNIFVPGGHRPN